MTKNATPAASNAIRGIAISSCALAALVASAPRTPAQSFDCGKARAPIEVAICASPDLARLDSALARDLAGALESARDDAARAQDLRAAQREWVAARNRNCAPLASAPARMAGCLAESYRARVAALAQAPAPQTRLPDEPAAPEALLSRASVSAVDNGEALVEVKSAGRFSIQAKSKSGVALQLVDMIAGPGAISGDAGARDGRLDVLLDKGAYKLRTFGDKKANGEAALSIQPFRAVANASSDLLRGGATSADLADLQQRSYWVIVDSSRRLSFEAAGRALRDLRVWREGLDLSELAPSIATIEPKTGHPMTKLRLEGTLEPGLYLVTAYGGDPAKWANGDTAQPFHARAGAAPVIAGGWRDGAIGPMGVARFEIPAPATHLRLELPEPAAARLAASRIGGGSSAAVIAKNSREPVAALSLAASGRNSAMVEVSGLDGQPFRLRALTPSSSPRVDASGPHAVSVDVAGEGGDEVPAMAVLARYQGGAGTVLSSSAPRIIPGSAWRRRFNLRGATTLIFEITDAGPVSANVQGVAARTRLDSLVGGRAPNANDKTPNLWDVEPGWYRLEITPTGAAGVADVTFGQPGLVAELQPAEPPRAAIDLGVHAIERPAFFQVFTNSAPGLVTGPRASALPADLSAGALALQQPARMAGVMTPRVPSPAPIVAPPPSPAPKPAAAPARATQQTVKKPPAGKPGPKPVAAAPKPLPMPARPAPVALPGRTADASGALVIPVRAPVGGRIVASDVSGKPIEILLAGESVEKDIRSATVTVPPSETARTVVLSFVKNEPPTPMPTIAARADTPGLAAGTPVFMDLENGARRSYLIDVPAGGLTRVETLGRMMTEVSVSTSFLPRLAAAKDNGAGHNALLQTYLRAGTYRVAVGALESSGRLGLVARPAALIPAGTLAPGGSVRATLAAGAGAAIQIDILTAGDYRLDVYGLGREFTTRLEDAEGWPLTQPGKMSSLDRRFEPGRYRLVVLPETVDARVVARLRKIDDDAPLAGHGPHPLPFDEAQTFQWREPASKDAPRTPDRWEFALPGPANVTLDIGDGMAGELVETSGAPRSVAKIAYKRGFSGVLPAGRYAVEARALGRNDRLDYELSLKAREIQPDQPRNVDLPASIPFAIARDRVVNLTTHGRAELRGVLRDAKGKVIERLSGRADDWNIALSRPLPAGEYRLDLTEAKAAVEAGKSEDDADEAPARGERRDNDGSIEVSFELPETAEARNLPMTGAEKAAGARVHQFNLARAEAGALLAVAARSTAELALAIERREANGTWVTLGFERGREPVVAAPADGDASKPWRVSVWAIDGGAAEIAIGARAIAAQPQAPGEIRLNALNIEGVAPNLRVAGVRAPGKIALVARERAAGLSQGSSPGRPLAPADGGVIAPQSETLWLLARAGAPETLHVEAPPADARAFDLDLAAGDVATLPVPPLSDGRLRVWRAASSLGQPGVSAGAGMGVAPGIAIAFSDEASPRTWNAGGADDLRLRVEAIDVDVSAPADIGARHAATLPPNVAKVLRAPAGGKQINLDLAAGVAARLSGGARDTTILAAGPTSRRLTGDWTQITLVNLGATPAPVAVDVSPSREEPALTAGAAMKRFFGAAGSISLPVTARAGDRLVVAGGAATFIGDDGRVTRGSPIELASSGELVIEHGPGLVAAWIESATATPWALAPATTVSTPRVLALTGAAQAFALKTEAPALLRARTDAPVIMALRRGDGTEAPELFPAGAEFHRYLAPGDAELRVYPPHEGPLSGRLELSTIPVTEIGEGVGEEVVLAPGASTLFGFEVRRAARIGVGVRSSPDRASVRLLDASGKPLGEGLAQMRRLEPGRYLLEARAPADGDTLVVRPAVVGVSPPDNGPPPDVARRYFELVGLTPTRNR